jgi:hypothetical protein
MVKGASKVFVPTSQVADLFERAGYESGDIVVTGLCVEPPLVAQAAAARNSRLSRYDSTGPLTVALYSSGAEPAPHVELLASALVSIVRAGHRAVAVFQGDGQFERVLRRVVEGHRFSAIEIEPVAELPDELPQVTLAPMASRQDEYQLTARLFPRFDLFMGPPHERSNWAVGLGLPMLAIEPAIGPFAPLNRELLMDRGVARIISASGAKEAGDLIGDLRSSGELARMSEQGWDREPIDGFATAANYLVQRYGAPA